MVLEMVKMFVSYGADLTLTTPDGKTVFTICDNDETHDEVCAIWNMREKLRSNIRSIESNGLLKPLHRRRSASSVHRTSMREKSNLSRREAKEEAQFAHSSSNCLTDIPTDYEKFNRRGSHENDKLKSADLRHEKQNVLITDIHMPLTSNGMDTSDVTSPPKVRLPKPFTLKHEDRKRGSRFPILLSAKDCETNLGEYMYPDDNTHAHSQINRHNNQGIASRHHETEILPTDLYKQQSNSIDGRAAIIDKRSHAGSISSPNPGNDTPYLTNREVYIDHTNFLYQKPCSSDLPIPEYIDAERSGEYPQTLISNKCCRSCTII
ncbi:unnamed protein product [Heterobilharzia americana]|nr:unnamed protein product [Heterobilharzia americana]